jgi:5'-nucleotidase
MAMDKRKLILLTNDDGIAAEGILRLRRALSEIADCVIVAPASERSACSHAITLHGELYFEEELQNGELIGYKVKGMPADCVKLALCELLDRRPDLIVSGINNGANVGISIYYSGTVSAAREGAILGIPSLALSVVRATEEILTFAASLGTRIAERMLANAMPAGTLLNVNIPDCDPAKIKGIQVANQADSYFDEWFVKAKNNGSKNPAYVLHGDMVLRKPDERNDMNVIRDGYVAITPLRIDLTDYNAMGETRALTDDLNNIVTEVRAQ